LHQAKLSAAFILRRKMHELPRAPQFEKLALDPAGGENLRES
jgi:hypothetical protein